MRDKPSIYDDKKAYDDNTVNDNKRSISGPLSPIDDTFSEGRRKPGFSGAPGEGPNPADVETGDSMPPPPLKPK